MALYALGDIVPQIDPEAFVHPEATIIGNVVLGPGVTVWPQAVLRGDQSRIVVGARTSVQDGAVLHCTRELETVVGADCTIGHLAHLEGCIVEDGALVGTGSIVLHRAIVRTGALVGAGAVVPNGMEVPSGAMALGVPAQAAARRGQARPGHVPRAGVPAQLGALPRRDAPHRLNASRWIYLSATNDGEVGCGRPHALGAEAGGPQPGEQVGGAVGLVVAGRERRDDCRPGRRAPRRRPSRTGRRALQPVVHLREQRALGRAVEVVDRERRHDEIERTGRAADRRDRRSRRASTFAAGSSVARDVEHARVLVDEHELRVGHARRARLARWSRCRRRGRARAARLRPGHARAARSISACSVS